MAAEICAEHKVNSNDGLRLLPVVETDEFMETIPICIVRKWKKEILHDKALKASHKVFKVKGDK